MKPHALFGFVALFALPAVAATPAHLVRDVVPGFESSNPARLAEVAGRVVFTIAYPPEWGETEIWSSDGTEEGTSRLAFVDRWFFDGFVASEGKLFFSQFDYVDYIGPDDLPRPWVTDGTPGGTLRLSNAEALGFAPLGSGALFLGRTPGTSLEPWRTNGTVAGTALVGVEPRWGPSSLTLGTVGDRALIWVSGYPGPRKALWTSDGSVEGTTRILLFPSDTGGWLERFYGAGEQTYFHYNGLLWRTDGTAEGTLAQTPPHPVLQTAAVGSSLFLALRDETTRHALWKTIEEGSAFVQVHENIGGGAHPPSFLTAGVSTLYFSGYDGDHGQELWRSDGTREGTGLVRDIRPGLDGSDPHAATEIDGVVLFAASDGTHGFEVWRSNGKETGTVLVQDVAPGPSSSNPREFRASGSRIFFSADDGVHGRELWAGWRGILTGNARRALFDLRAEVEGLGVPGLLSKVNAAASALELGDRPGAACALGLFGRALARMRDRQVPAGAVDSLADLTAQTIDLLGGSSSCTTFIPLVRRPPATYEIEALPTGANNLAA